MAKYHYQHGDKPLAGYTIQRGVGRGGFGEVYYAVSDTGRQVALKAVQTYEQIELRGIQQCMNLKNPHLVSVFDIKYNDEGKLFVIMEYVSGPSLGDLIRESPGGLGVQKTAFFLREIAKGLNYLHECGIVHRDLKPGNIFYEDGQVKIGDYGLSKMINTSRYSNQTITVGTVHYMAPEIGVGKYDRSIDIYAMGVMLYEMLTGQVPFVGASPAEVLMKHMNATPDLSGIDETFARVIRKSMARDPKDRYPTVQAMVEDVFGAASVQQSMSQFSPQELSMVAEKVAAKIQKQAAAAPSTDTAEPKPGSKGDFLYSKAKAIHNIFYEESEEELKAAAAKDPLKEKQRILLAMLTSIILSMAAGMFIGHRSDEIIGIGFLIFLMILGGAGGLLLARYKLLKDVDSKPFCNWIAAGIAIVMSALLSIVMWNDGPDEFQNSYMRGTFFTLAVLVIPNWWKLTSVHRKNRIQLAPAILLSALAFIIAIPLHGQPVVSIAAVAGICLYVQILSPFVGARQIVESKKEKPRPTHRPVQTIQPGASSCKRSVAAILCGLIFLAPGLHRFYVRKIGTGLLWFFTGGLLGIGQLIDFILILSGEFRDKQGQKLLDWGNRTPTPKGTHPAAANAANIPHNERVSAVQPGFAKNVTPVSTDSRSTTVVIEDPTAKAGVLNVICGFFGYLLFIIGFIVLLTGAFHVPTILSACVPAGVVSQIEHVWGTPNWPTAIENLVITASLCLLIVAAIFILISRRRAGAGHIIRFVIAMALLAIGMTILFDSIEPARIQGSLAGQPIGIVFEQVSRVIGDEVFASLIFFVPSLILLAWPPARKPPQIVTLNPDTQNKPNNFQVRS